MDRFWRLLKVECYKAFKNPFFFIATGSGMIFALMSALYNIDSYHLGQKQLEILGGNPMVQAYGLYNSWIGGESHSIGFALFFTLLPLLAVFPYGWSYCMERKTGYTKIAVVRGGKQSYFIAKYIAAFISGGSAVIIPLVSNFLLTACFIPAVHPSLQYAIYYSVGHGSLWSELFYSHPLVFVFCYLLLDFVFAGLFAALGLAFSVYGLNSVSVVVLPFLLVLCMHYGRVFLYYRMYKEISPLNFLHAACVENNVSGWIVLAEGVVLFLISFVSVMKAGTLDEIW